MLNNAFCQLLKPKQQKNCRSGRIKGDLERVFTNVDTFEDEVHYKYRAFIERRVEKVIASKVADINYSNFKGSVCLRITRGMTLT